ILPDLSIASKRSVRSLLLIAKRPIAEVQSIALDKSSRSTQALTKILCVERWKIAPEFHQAEPDAYQMLKGADAALVIGDPALHLATMTAAACLGNESAWFKYDIVEEWRALTGLPAVLAVWAARAEVVTPELIDDFQRSRDLGMERIAEISGESSLEMGMPAE